MLDTTTTKRESADNYHTVIEKTENHRIIPCSSDQQWIIQKRSGISAAGPRWRSICYCTTHEALGRLWPQHTGLPLLANLPERIGGIHG